MSLIDPGPGNRTENPVLGKANRGHAQHKQHQSIISAQPAGNCVFVQCLWKVSHSKEMSMSIYVQIFLVEMGHDFFFQDLNEC